MKVHILEDNKIQRENLKEIVEREIRGHGYDMELGTIDGNPKSFFKKTKISGQDIFFIDIDLKQKMTGFDVGKKIRELENEKTGKQYLIYVTAFDDQMPLTYEYKLEVLDYISKNNTAMLQAKIAECLNVIQSKRFACKEEQEEGGYFSYIAFKKEIKIPIKDIVYIQSGHNILLVVTDNKMCSVRMTMKEAEEKLSNTDFLKANESILINRSQIKTMDLENKIVILHDNIKIPISHRVARNLKKN